VGGASSTVGVCPAAAGAAAGMPGGVAAYCVAVLSPWLTAAGAAAGWSISAAASTGAGDAGAGDAGAGDDGAGDAGDACSAACSMCSVAVDLWLSVAVP